MFHGYRPTTLRLGSSMSLLGSSSGFPASQRSIAVPHSSQLLQKAQASSLFLNYLPFTIGGPLRGIYRPVLLKVAGRFCCNVLHTDSRGQRYAALPPCKSTAHCFFIDCRLGKHSVCKTRLDTESAACCQCWQSQHKCYLCQVRHRNQGAMQNWIANLHRSASLDKCGKALICKKALLEAPIDIARADCGALILKKIH